MRRPRVVPGQLDLFKDVAPEPSQAREPAASSPAAPPARAHGVGVPVTKEQAAPAVPPASEAPHGSGFALEPPVPPRRRAAGPASSRPDAPVSPAPSLSGAFANAAASCRLGALEDAALIAAIPDATSRMIRDLAAEAGRRRLQGAIPALQALCRRFKGFGRHTAASEQRAALEALAEIGGPAARIALQTLMREDVFPPPALHWVARAAARLGCRLPVTAALQLLRDPDPEVRAEAAACVPVSSETTKVLTELLHDPAARVAEAAACALGRMGRPEARPVLLRVLQTAPTEEAIEAATYVPNETTIVMLGRIARAGSPLAPAALAALREIEDARASRLISVLEAELDRPEGDSAVPADKGRRRA